MEQFISFLSSHWMLSLGFLVTLILLAINELFNVKFGIPKLNCQNLTTLMNRGDVELIDMRPEGDFIAGHILGAKNIPQKMVMEKAATLKAEKPTILIDASGQQSALVGAKLRKLGFAQVMYLAGGLASWRTDGLPLTKGKS